MTVRSRRPRPLKSGHIWPVPEPLGSRSDRPKDRRPVEDRFASWRTIATVTRRVVATKVEARTGVCESSSCPDRRRPHVHRYPLRRVLDGKIEVHERLLTSPLVLAYEWLRDWSRVNVTVFGVRCWTLLPRRTEQPERVLDQSLGISDAPL